MVIYIIFLLAKILSLKYTYVRNNIKDPLAKIPLCIGKINDKPQCIKAVLDTTFFFIIIAENNKENTVNFNKSKSIDKTDLIYYEYFIRPDYYFYRSNVYLDYFYFNDDFKYIESKQKNKFIISNLMEIEHDGIIGIGRKYTNNFINKKNPDNQESEIDSDESYSFMKILSDNFINDKVISFNPITPNQSIILIGERENLGKYKKCYSIDYIENNKFYEDLWNCKLDYIKIIDNGKKFKFNNDRYAVFDSNSKNVILPYDIGIEIFNYIIKKVNVNCFIIQMQINTDYEYLECNDKINLDIFPNILFSFKDLELVMRKNDFIRPSLIKGFYKINIIASKNIDYINIGLPILKNYYVIFDYKDNSIGFPEDKGYLYGNPKSKNKNYYIILILLLINNVILLIPLIIYVYLVRKKKYKFIDNGFNIFI